MMGDTRRGIAILALALAGCSNQIVPASTPTSDAVVIRLNATSATLPLINDLTRSYAQVRPGVTFEISSGNYQAAARAASGAAGIYFLSNHLPPPEASLIWGAPVGQDGIAIITHLGNPLNDLSIEQLRSIFQGQISNWATLGGPDLPITVISREDGSGTRAEFNRLLMGERRTTQSARIAPSSAAVITSVSRQTGSIGYVSMSLLDSSVQALRLAEIAPTQANVQANSYPLRTTLFIAGPAEPQGALRQFIAWVQSPDGQAVVAERYSPL
jgi:phosphate transport system substrate-binding protein